MCTPFSGDLYSDIQDAILYPDPDEGSYEFWVVEMFANAWNEVDESSYREFLEEHGDDRRAITNLMGSLFSSDRTLFKRFLEPTNEILPLSSNGIY